MRRERERERVAFSAYRVCAITYGKRKEERNEAAKCGAKRAKPIETILDRKREREMIIKKNPTKT